MALIYGTDSDIVRPYDRRSMQRAFKHMIVRRVKGGHLFPLEKPEETARIIREVIELL